MHDQIRIAVQLADAFAGRPTARREERIGLVLIHLLTGITARFVAVLFFGGSEDVHFTEYLFERLQTFSAETFPLPLMPVARGHEIERMRNCPLVLGLDRHGLSRPVLEAGAIFCGIAHSRLGP